MQLPRINSAKSARIFLQMIDPRVDPQRFEGDAAQVVVEVHQVVRDLQGKIKSDQMVRHLFLFEEGLVKVFKIL